jgi:hypothetical protein
MINMQGLGNFILVSQSSLGITGQMVNGNLQPF